MRVFILSLALSLTATSASAQDRVLLAEILPALEGSTLGAIDLGPAPAPGATRAVRRPEILAAIAEAGRSAEGLDIPRQTRIVRRAIVLTGSDIESRARAAIETALAPCVVERIVVTTSATIGEGDLRVLAEGPARPTDGAAVVMLGLSTGSLATHVPARVDLACPEPIVHSGSTVTVVVRSGAVRVSAPGTARGEGRVGDTVRVRIESTGRLVSGRVQDDGTIEVRP